MLAAGAVGEEVPEPDDEEELSESPPAAFIRSIPKRMGTAKVILVLPSPLPAKKIPVTLPLSSNMGPPELP